MHKLARTSVPVPRCLTGYDHKTQTWDDLGHECKREVRLALQRMQGQLIATEDADDEAEYIIGLRCAYCEGTIYFGGHIEHFRRKNPKHYPELTFGWTNLFLACGSHDHCGHYKDRPSAAPYDPDHLIKPDEHDPDDYLYFHSSGEVRVRHREGMPDADRHLGAETIRVFHLNVGHLTGARHKALKQYLDSKTGIIEALMEFGEPDRNDFIREEVEATKWEPYWSTIRHFFEKI